MEEKEKVLKAALAGLLHDVGKLEQRARADPWNPAPGIDQEGQPVHATWSIYFIQQYVPKEYQAAALAGAYHHAPMKSPAEDKRLSELIALADKLSAGERADPIETGKRPPMQQITIFDCIYQPESQLKSDLHYLPIKGLKLDQAAIFPSGEITQNEQGAAYDQLCESLRKAARQPIQNAHAYLEHLLGAMKQYTWSAPSAYYHSMPDVSLYDHSRMTAALAACLAEQKPEDIQRLLSAVENDFRGNANGEETALLAQPVALLVGGDISGIQDFIYTISSKGAAKTLRGRSLYLQLLTEAVLRQVLNELALPYTNVIYSGGGHFYLLAPLSAEEKLPAIQKEVTRKLLEHHGINLYLAIGRSSIPANGFRVGVFPEHWGRMHGSLGQAKQQRYIEMEEELYAKVFDPPAQGGNPHSTCSVCGQDRYDTHIWDEEREEQARICSMCQSFIEQLGKPLPAARFVALGLGGTRKTERESAFDVLNAFGMQVQFLEGVNQAIELPGAERVVIWALGDEPDGIYPGSDLPTSHQLHYMVNRVPDMTFDELQEQTEGGFKRLGVLRMDVDDLGEIFKHGLGKMATLARLSTLSFQVSLFFEGWVKQLCENKAYRGLVYAVYAGGDDVFLIGPWDRMPGLALAIRNDFQQYTGSHPGIHLSAGLAFIGGKYPIYQAAADAKDALDQAKDEPGKEAFSFLGTAWKWADFEKVNEKHERLSHLVGGKESDAEGLEGPQAVLQILRQLAQDEADEARRNKGRPVWGPWMWRGAYMLRRMAERYTNTQPKLAEAILGVRDELDTNNYQDINQWGTAARWTQLEVRSKRNE